MMPVRLRAACQSDKLVDGSTATLYPPVRMYAQPQDRSRAAEAKPCKRPVWGDGFVDGEWFGFCSYCWHEWKSFHNRKSAQRLGGDPLPSPVVMVAQQDTEPFDSLELAWRLQQEAGLDVPWDEGRRAA